MKCILVILINIFIFFSSCKTENKNLKKYFKYNEDAVLNSLDPAFASDQAVMWACSQLYNSLIQLDSQLKPKPCLASSWEYDTASFTYIFHLRKDVFFHPDNCFKEKQNRRMVADDVVFSLSRIANPKTASTGLWLFKDKIDTTFTETDFYRLDNIKAINDSTLQIKLLKPVPYFLQLLAMQYCSVIPHEAIDFYGKDFARHPVGTGPFLYKFWNENIRLVFDKNPFYFETENGKKLPYLDGVEITFVESKQTAFLEFAQGKLDFFKGAESSFKDIILEKNGELKNNLKDKYDMQTEPFLNTEYLGLLQQGEYADKALKNIKVRQALNYAIDREKLIIYLRNNMGTPAYNGIIPKGLPGYDSTEIYSYDIEKAKALIKESGFKANEINLTLYTSNNYLDMSVIIQKQLKNLGINVNIDIGPGAAQRVKIKKGMLSFFRASWIADYPDAENYLSLFYSKNKPPFGPNYTQYENREFDALYEKAMLETNENKRENLYIEMNHLMMEDAPVIVLFYDKSVRFSQKWIQGMTNDPMNGLNLLRVRKL